MAALLKELNLIWRANLDHLKQKQNDPGQKIVLESSSAASQSVLTLLNDANDSLAKHNSLIRKHGSEQRKLKSEVCRFPLDDSLKATLESFEMKRSNCEAAIQSLNDQIGRLEHDKKMATGELRKLEQQVTSVEPTVRQMNDLAI